MQILRRFFVHFLKQNFGEKWEKPCGLTDHCPKSQKQTLFGYAKFAWDEITRVGRKEKNKKVWKSEHSLTFGHPKKDVDASRPLHENSYEMTERTRKSARA